MFSALAFNDKYRQQAMRGFWQNASVTTQKTDNLIYMKVKCKTCAWLNYSFIFDRYQQRKKGDNICDLHGGASVDIGGEQPNLDNRGGCGYHKKKQCVQLELFDF